MLSQLLFMTMMAMPSTGEWMHQEENIPDRHESSLAIGELGRRAIVYIKAAESWYQSGEFLYLILQMDESSLVLKVGGVPRTGL